MTNRDLAVRAFAPATSANLGPGFDVLGMAIQGLGDTVVASRTTRPGVSITSIVGDDGRLPLRAEENTAGIAAIETLRKAGLDIGVDIELHKGMPIGSGLGSSAASAAAAAFAVNTLVGSPLRRIELIGPCVEAEVAVAGRHADNVAPALLGGLILVRSVDPLDVQRIPVPHGLIVTIVTPSCELETRAARDALPETIPIAAMVANGANIATMISACYSGDISLFGRCIIDNVVTPERTRLVPGAEAAIDAALRNGALGSSISGSGPSIFAFCHSTVVADRVAEAMISAFGQAGLTATAVVSPGDCPGARRL